MNKQRIFTIAIVALAFVLVSGCDSDTDVVVSPTPVVDVEPVRVKPKNDIAITGKVWCLGATDMVNPEMVQLTARIQIWCLNGVVHREDGPAVKFVDGHTFWWLNGKRHRVDGPAVELKNGTKLWYQTGKLHNDNGPAEDWAGGK